jgi:hypothetical protein
MHHLRWGRGPLSVPWDKGTLSTKLKELYPGPPRAGSWVQRKTCTPTSYNLCQEGGQRQATHQVPGEGLGSSCGGCPHIKNPLKGLAQTVSEPTPDERCDPVKSFVASLPQILPYNYDNLNSYTGGSRQIRILGKLSNFSN